GVKTVSAEGAAYTWEFEVRPGETKILSYSYNYSLPFVLVLLTLIFLSALYFISKKDILVKKAFVGKAHQIKEGQPLKICVEVINRTRFELTDLVIDDFVQPLFRLEKEFSGVSPTRLSRKGDDIKITWSVARLEPKETRVFTYKITPKVGIGGAYSFSLARVIYRSNNIRKVAYSDQPLTGK
ncbi:MAG: hypothetical protein ACP5E4_01810, partial [Candidatus Aenigmatarchaeota archaeon]